MKSFLQQTWLYFKGDHSIANISEYIVLEMGQPFLNLIFYCLVASYSYKTNDLSFWVIGNMYLLSINICVFKLGATFMGERVYKRIRAIISAPRSKFLCIIEKSLFPIFQAIITVLLGFFIASIIFKLEFVSTNIILLLSIVFSGIFAIACFGIFLSTVGLISDNIMHFLLNTIQYILLIFTGAEFPISQLPTFMQLISKVLPLTHAIEATNELYNGVGIDIILPLLIKELIVGIIYCIIAVIFIKYTEQISRKNGKYDFF